MSKGSWEVSEAEYTPSGNGPGEDTESFYVGTPAPGERQHYEHAASPPEATKPSLLERATPGWIKRVARPDERPTPEASEAPGSTLPLGAIALGVVSFSGMLTVMAIIGWFVFSPATVTESPRSATQGAGEEEQQNEQFQGVKVKKGLK